MSGRIDRGQSSGGDLNAPQPGRQPGERGRMPYSERLRSQFNSYLEAIARHDPRVGGQDSPMAQAARMYEEYDPTEGPNRHYWVDYSFRTEAGESIFLRFQHAGHIPANNFDWRTSRGHVHYYMSPTLGLMLLYSDSGGAWFNPAPSRHPDWLYAPVPTMPNVKVSTRMIRASHGWLERFLDVHSEHYAQAKGEVDTALERYHAGETLPPFLAADWDEAEAHLNQHGARHFPEQLMHLLLQFSQATGIMSFTEWVKAQETTNSDASNAADS